MNLKKLLLKILLVISITLLTGIAGGLIFKFFVPKPGMGWDSLADFIGYFFGGMVIGFIGAMWLVNRGSPKQQLKATIISVSIIVIIILFSVLRGKSQELPSSNRIAPMGMIRVPFNSEGKIYFYSRHDFQFSIVDSLVIKNYQISYAPPWFAPHYFKEDYQVLLLHAYNLAKHYVLAEVNQYNRLKYYVSKDEIIYESFPEFLLSVHSVKTINDKTEVYNSPQNGSLIKRLASQPLTPIEIRGNWMKIADKNDISLGWIIWKNDEKILVTYDLLS